VIALVAVLALWNSFYVYVKPGTHLVVIAKRGELLSPNQVLADEGQAGIQRRVLGEGWHFVLPIVYETERHPNVVVPAGQIGIVTAPGRHPNAAPPARTTASAPHRGGPPCPGGRARPDEAQQGTQRRVWPPGDYGKTPSGSPGKRAPAVDIPAGFVGVQRRLL